jgi:type VI secretion system secreted protein Hcp
MIMAIYANFGSDMPGSSTKEPHVDWMELASFTHGIDRPFAPGGRWDPANIHDFVFTKTNDKSSPKFNHAILAGKPFPEVEIHFCTTVGGEEEAPYYIIKLEQVRITSYNLSGQSEGESYETISMYADKAAWTYSVQDEESEKGKVEYAYDIKGRKAG